MDRKSEDETPPGFLLPPARTQRNGDHPTPQSESRLAPPFVGGHAIGPAMESPRAMPEPPASSAAPQDDALWEPEEEGTVESMFQADTDEVLAELQQQANREDFPLDAFIIPEQTQRVPNGFEPRPLPAPPEPTALISLADRLEKLSHRLRVEDVQVVLRHLAGGDRLDALLAGLLAGYLAGTSDKR